MKKLILPTFILVAVVVAILLFWDKRDGDKATQATVENQNGSERVQNDSPAKTNLSGSTPPNDAVSPVLPAIDQKMVEQIDAYVKGILADSTSIYKRPVSFYGKVLDELDQPVSGASVEFSWNKANSTNEVLTRNVETTTDAEGVFSLENETGNHLSVEVGKLGYYRMGVKPWFDYPGVGSKSSFEYADPSRLHTPDSNNPVVFRIRKKGQGVALVISKQGIRPDVAVRAPRDGTPVKVDLLKMKVGNEGMLEFSQVKPELMKWKQANQWSFQMTIPDGGFVEYQNQEFPFEAPEAGYEPMVKFEFQKDQTNWATHVTKDYFIRFGTPPMYGRLHLETSIGGYGASLIYAINPNAGSRNLEHDESLKPKP